MSIVKNTIKLIIAVKRSIKQYGVKEEMDERQVDRMVAANSIAIMASIFLITYIINILYYHADGYLYYLIPCLISFCFYAVIPFLNKTGRNNISLNIIAFVPVILITYITGLIGNHNNIHVIILTYPIPHLFIFRREDKVFNMFYITFCAILLLICHFYFVPGSTWLAVTSSQSKAVVTISYIVSAYIIFNSTMVFQNRLDKKQQTIADNALKLDDRNHRIERITKHKEELSTMIVHDLKTRLNAIIGLSKSAYNNAFYINSSGKKMLNMVLNILDIQKFEEAEMVLEKSLISIGKIICESILEVKYLSAERNIEINFHAENDFVVNVDRDLIQRVILNIIGNGIKYSNFNSQINVELAVDTEGLMEISIRDFGKGIPKDKQPLVFNKYWQQNNRVKEDGGRSTGLGLTFCKMVMEAHEGQISLQSREGYGTKVTLSMRVVQEIDFDKELLNIIHAPDLSDEAIFLETGSIEQLTEGPKELLHSFAERLSHFKTHEISDIWAVLKEIPEPSEFIKKWKSETENAALSGNEEHYMQLLRPYV